MYKSSPASLLPNTAGPTTPKMNAGPQLLQNRRSLPVFLPKLLHALTAGLLSIPVYRLFDAQLASSAAFAACGAGAGFALMELTLSVLACLIFRKMAASNLHRDRV